MDYGSHVFALAGIWPILAIVVILNVTKLVVNMHHSGRSSTGTTMTLDTVPCYSSC